MNRPPSDARDPSRWNMTPVPDIVAKRAFLRHEVDQHGCWISTYSWSNHGYSQIGWKREGKRHMVLAHRAAWVHINGQVPIGMTLDHLCKKKRCVNPSHLRLLSNYENARRNDGSDWRFGTCRNGHPDSMLREVRRVAKSGRRYLGLQCGECSRETQRRYRERNAPRNTEPR